MAVCAWLERNANAVCMLGKCCVNAARMLRARRALAVFMLFRYVCTRLDNTRGRMCTALSMLVERGPVLS
eukprot:4750206-Lingulodinium_polyedra.AAC.1